MITSKQILIALVVTLLGLIAFMGLSRREEPKVIRFEHYDYQYDSVKIKTQHLILYKDGIPKHLYFREQLILIE